MSDREKRDATGVPVGLVVAVLIVGGSIAMVFVRAFGERGDGWDDILEFLPFLAAGLAGGIILNTAYGEIALARRRRLTRENGDAIVFTAEMTPTLKAILKVHDGTSLGTPRRNRAPYFFTVVASDQGITLWGGTPTRPRSFWQIDWESIAEIQLARIQLQFKAVHGLTLKTHRPDGTFQIAPFPERGFARSWKRERTERLEESLSDLRSASLKL